MKAMYVQKGQRMTKRMVSLTNIKKLFFSAGFYLISPSEYERFSLSAKVLTEPLCFVHLDRPLEPTPTR